MAVLANGIRFFCSELFLLLLTIIRQCKLAIVYPLPSAMWIVSFDLTIRHRVALSNRVLGPIKIEHLLSSGFVVCTFLWGVAGGALLGRDFELNQTFWNWNVVVLISAAYMFLAVILYVVAKIQSCFEGKR